MKYQLANKMIQVTVDEHGAELTSVKGVNSHFEYLWQADPKVWGKHSPVLFPIVGALRDDQYQYAGKTYHLGQHGFAHNEEFTLAEKTDTKIVLSLKSNDRLKEMYPFDFELLVSYELLNNMIQVEYQVKNLDDKEMIFGIGGHPGFNLPVEDGHKKTDYYLAFTPAKERVKFPIKDRMIDWAHRSIGATNTLIGLTDDLFKDDALIYELSGENKVTLRRDDGEFHINLWTEGAKFIGIWSQYPATADYVCLEPWWGIADRNDGNGNFEDKYGMNHLASGETFKASFKVSFNHE
ncbi:MAG: aldose 1-epimerase family protein [Lactobacillus sp.]|nr:aldose 1-epimerase family protein [Lactobacillus sp.]